MGRGWFILVARLSVMLAVGGGAVVSATWVISRAGTSQSDQLAFQSDREGNWEIYLLDINRGLTHNLTRNPADDLGPAWSRATQQLAFYSSREQRAPQLYVMKLTSQRTQAVNPNRRGNWRPTWSPDGERLAFMYGYASIRIVNANGGQERDLAYGFSPVWSPIDGRIAFYADHPPRSLNADIYLLDDMGRNLHNLTQNQFHNWDPAWSPDGSQIVFISSRDGNPDLYVMNARCGQTPEHCGDGLRRLTHTTAMNATPAWSPDGRRIAFESHRDGYSHLYLVNADGNGLRRITFGRANNRFPVWIDRS
jgi:Tol biopolymer transport system component